MYKSFEKTKYKTFDYKNLLDEYIASAYSEKDFLSDDAKLNKGAAAILNETNAGRSSVIKDDNHTVEPKQMVYEIKENDKNTTNARSPSVNKDGNYKVKPKKIVNAINASSSSVIKSSNGTAGPKKTVYVTKENDGNKSGLKLKYHVKSAPPINKETKLKSTSSIKRNNSRLHPYPSKKDLQDYAKELNQQNLYYTQQQIMYITGVFNPSRYAMGNVHIPAHPVAFNNYAINSPPIWNTNSLMFPTPSANVGGTYNGNMFAYNHSSAPNYSLQAGDSNTMMLHWNPMNWPSYNFSCAHFGMGPILNFNNGGGGGPVVPSFNNTGIGYSGNGSDVVGNDSRNSSPASTVYPCTKSGNITKP